MPPPTSPIPTGRLAPSPTGGLHLGHARTFLIAWLSSRSQGGRVIYRVEDLDPSRTRPQASQDAMVDLRWLGLDWDEGPDQGGPSAPYIQSDRRNAYQATLDCLIADDRVYPCTCTRADIARAASAPHSEDEGPTYPRTCAHRSAADADRFEDRSFAWRFRVPEEAVTWIDRFLGEMALDPSRIGGDFVVARSGFGPAYQLAVVHDDAAMGVTEVVRGDDLVPSTPRQILLYQAMGWKPPSFGHIPLAVGPDGRRLAKRDGSIKLASLREAGVDPARLVGWLAQSSRWSERIELTRPADWLDRFDLGAIPRSPWVVSADRLRDWVGG